MHACIVSFPFVSCRDDELYIVSDYISPLDNTAACLQPDVLHCVSIHCTDSDRRCTRVSECRNGRDESATACSEQDVNK